MPSLLTRGLTAVALSGLATLAMAGTAHAEGCPYPPTPGVTCVEVNGQAVLSVTVLTTLPATITGDLPPAGDPNYGANTNVVGTGESTPFALGTFQADGAGHLHFTVTIPAGVANGQHEIVMTGVDASGGGLQYRIPFTVAVGAGAAGGLPFTGAEIGVASLVGASLLGVGSFAIVAGRKRKAAALPA